MSEGMSLDRMTDEQKFNRGILDQLDNLDQRLKLLGDHVDLADMMNADRRLTALENVLLTPEAQLRRDDAALHEACQEVEGLRNELAKWREVTGCSSPTEYNATKPYMED